MDCLRPEFSRALAERLSEGDCINLISPHGQGRRRTLEDLRRHCLPATTHVLQANLRDYPQSLSTMLGDLSTQAGLAGTGSMEALLDRLPQMAGRTLIVLHNFDELNPCLASGYDDAFFEALNGIHERVGIALLCVCEQVPEAWPLQIESIHLPPLTPEQLMAELARRNFAVPPESWPDIANWLAVQPAPYSLLEQPDTWPARYS
jgi:hypothetical protein